MQIYADNAATTKMSRAAIDAMLPYLDTVYGNPSSLHSAGQAAAVRKPVGASKSVGALHRDPLFGRLRDWRAREAGMRHMPAFQVMGNKTLEALVAAKPQNFSELLAVKGVGPVIADRYGTDLLRLINGD